MIKAGPLSDYVLHPNVFDQAHAKLLTDDRNFTDQQLKSHYLSVREKVRSKLSMEIMYANSFRAAREQ
jgi:hypothetical protein